MASDLRLWSADRIHLNADGHVRLAAAFAATFAGEGDRRWAEPLPPAPPPRRGAAAAAEAAWVARFVVPKIFRMIRGRSSGDGRSGPSCGRSSSERLSPSP